MHSDVPPRGGDATPDTTTPLAALQRAVASCVSAGLVTETCAASFLREIGSAPRPAELDPRELLTELLRAIEHGALGDVEACTALPDGRVAVRVHAAAPMLRAAFQRPVSVSAMAAAFKEARKRWPEVVHDASGRARFAGNRRRAAIVDLRAAAKLLGREAPNPKSDGRDDAAP